MEQAKTPRLLGLLAAVIALACETSPAAINEPAETWITEAAFEIGDELEGDALFARVDHVQVSVDGQRIFVLEGGIERLTVWTPAGSRLLDLGAHGDGPGDFMGAREIGLVEDGFYILRLPALHILHPWRYGFEDRFLPSRLG